MCVWGGGRGGEVLLVLSALRYQLVWQIGRSRNPLYYHYYYYYYSRLRNNLCGAYLTGEVVVVRGRGNCSKMKLNKMKHALSVTTTLLILSIILPTDTPRPEKNAFS